ncbi:MAG: hypothetical protein OEY59_09115 [Deltaproteobacteria bacterium]|nr:hypothetical protein [Deltaproteobacteria bacterium]
MKNSLNCQTQNKVFKPLLKGFKVLGVLFVYLAVFKAVALAEYRAFLLEVFDHIDKTKMETVTGFSPDKYLTTHGGGNRLSVLIKATWKCYGDTSQYDPPCLMPKPKKPLFQKGDLVKVNLKKHISEGWVGAVELSLYREDLRSNIYGIRFTDRKQMYGRYYEFDLERFRVEIKTDTDFQEQPKTGL